MTEQETKIQFDFLIKRLTQLLTKPSETWAKIRDEEAAETVQFRFFYPCLGILALVVFSSRVFLGLGWTDAIQHSTAYTMGLFITYWGGSALVDLVWQKRTDGPSAIAMWRQVIGYSLAIPMATELLSIVSQLSDLLAIIQIVVILGKLYIFYILWEALIVLVGLKEDQLFVTMVVLGFLCLFSPWAIEQILLLLLDV